MENREVFVLVHGGGQSKECFDDIRSEFVSLGHRSIAMDLPVSDPRATFDDYARVVEGAVGRAVENEELKEQDEVLLVGHSRGANVIPRVAGIAVKKLIFVCPSFEYPTVASLIDREDFQNLPQKRTTRYEDAIIPIGGGLTRFNPGKVRGLLFAGCPPEVQDRALKQLRPQHRSADEPVLEAWPAHIPQAMVFSTDDLVITPSWSRAIASVINTKPIEISDGHFPFLSRPRELARLLISLA